MILTISNKYPKTKILYERAWDTEIRPPFWRFVCHAGKEGITNGTKDAKSKTGARSAKAPKFKKEGRLCQTDLWDPILCSQFLKKYIPVPLLKDVQPEDIEDVTERYVHMFTEERDSDVVKKVHMKDGENTFYLVSLTEHKSNVDYNVVMQVLRYMVFIWEEYEREMNREHEGISRTKGFRYCWSYFMTA